MAAEVAKKATPGEVKTREGTPLLTATLHKTHLVSVMGGDALSVAVETQRLETSFSRLCLFPPTRALILCLLSLL